MKKIKSLKLLTLIIILGIYIIESKAENSTASSDIVVSPLSSEAGVSIESAANPEVPVINISTPDDSGTSYNRFDNFNVSTNGVVINNSKAHINTQIGGQILANPNLSGSIEASLIINHVVSEKASKIEGPTEIAGRKADYILANSSGIILNGGEFINASSVVLTTGTPVNIKYGDIDVESGEIEISSKDLDLRDLDYFDVISKSVKIASKIHTKDTKIFAGKNKYQRRTRDINIKPSSASSVAIDSSNLGGIYSGKITIIASEEGAGANLPNINSEQELIITADGKIVHKSLSADQISIESKSSDIVASEGSKIESRKEFSSVAGKKIIHEEDSSINSKVINLKSKEILSKAKISTTSTTPNDEKITITSDNIFIDGTIEVAGEVDLKDFHYLTNAGLISAKKILKLSGDHFFNFGSINSGFIVADAKESITNKLTGQISGETININSESFINDGRLSAYSSAAYPDLGEINITSKNLVSRGLISASGTLEIISSGIIENIGKIRASKTIIKPKVLINNDTISSSSLEIINADEINNLGTILSKEKTKISSKLFSNKKSATWISNDDLNLESEVINLESNSKITSLLGGVVINAKEIVNNGQISSHSDLSFAGKIDSLKSFGNIKSKGNILINDAIEVVFSSASINSTGDITIFSDSIYFDSSMISSSEGKIAIKSSKSYEEKASTIFSNKGIDFSGRNARFSTQGSITTYGNISISLEGETFSSVSIFGKLLSKSAIKIKSLNLSTIGDTASLESGSFNLETDLFKNAGIVLARGDDLDIKSPLGIANTGDIISGGELILFAESLIESSGRIAANGNIRADARDFKNTGSVESGGKFTISAKEVELGAGRVASEMGMKIEAENFKNAGIVLARSDDLDIKSPLGIANTGDIISGGELILFAESFIESSGRILANRNIRADARDFKNTGTVESGGKFTISAKEVDLGAGRVASEMGMKIEAENFKNAGIVLARGDDLDIKSPLGIANTGDIISGGELILFAESFIESSGRIAANGNIKADARDFKNTGIFTTSDRAIFNLTDKFENKAEIKVGSVLEINSQNLVNSGIIKSKDLLLNLKSNADNTEEGIILTIDAIYGDIKGDLNNRGLIEIKNGHDKINIRGFVNNKGEIIASRLKLDVGETLQNEGIIRIYDSGDIEVQKDVNSSSSALIYFGGESFKLSSSNTISKGKIYLKSGETRILSRENASFADLFSLEKLTLSANNNLKFEGKAILADLIIIGNSNPRPHSIDISGTVQSELFLNLFAINQVSVSEGAAVKSLDGFVNITSKNITNNGTIFGKNLEISSEENDILEIGKIGSSHLTKITTPGKIIIPRSSAITSNGKIYLQGRELLLGGTIYGARESEIVLGREFKLSNSAPRSRFVDGSVSNSPTLYSNGAIRIKSSALSLESNSQIFSRDGIIIESPSITVTSGTQLASASDMRIYSDSLKNMGIISTEGILSLISNSSIYNSSYIQARGMQLESNSIVNQSHIISDGHLKMTGIGGAKSGDITNYSTIFGNGIEIKSQNFTNYNSGYSFSPAKSKKAILDEYFAPNRMAGFMNAIKDISALASEKKMHEGSEYTFSYLIDTYSLGTPASLISRADISIDVTNNIQNSKSNINASGSISLNGRFLTNESQSIYKKGVYHKDDSYSYTTKRRVGERWFRKDEITTHTESCKRAFDKEELYTTISSIISGRAISGNLSGGVYLGGAYSGGAISKRSLSEASLPPVLSVSSDSISSEPELRALQTLSDSDFSANVLREINSEESAFGDEESRARRTEGVRLGSLEIEFDSIPEIRFFSSEESKPLSISSSDATSTLPETIINPISEDVDESFEKYFINELDPSYEGEERVYHNIMASFDSEKWKPSAKSSSFSILDKDLPARRYKIETRPQYIDPSRFFSGENFAKRIPGFKHFHERSGISSISYMSIIRKQISDLVGILDESKSEEEIIQELYDNADKEARRISLKPGISLSKDEVASLRNNIIWHEKISRGGKTYLVPRIYLAGGKIKRSGLIASDHIGIKAASIETSSEISAKSILLKSSGEIANIGGKISASNLFMQSDGAFINIEGKVLASDHLTLKSGSDLLNLGGLIKSSRDALIEASTISLISEIQQEYIGGGFAEKISAESLIDVGGKATITANGDFVMKGAALKAGSLDLKSSGDVIISSVMLSSSRESSNHKEFHQINKGSAIEVSSDAKISADGDLELYSSVLKAGGEAQIAAGGVVSVEAGIDSHDYEFTNTSKKKKAFGSSSTKTTITQIHDENLSVAGIESGSRLTISSGASLDLKGAKLKAKDVSLSGEEVSIGAKALSSARSSSSNYKDRVIVSRRFSGRSSEVHHETTIDGELSFGKIGEGGVKAEVHKASPLLAKLDDVEGVTYKVLTDKTSSYAKRIRNLTPEAGMLVTAAATISTAGMASGAAGAIAGTGTSIASTAGHAAIVAGLGSATGQFAVSAINNNGNLGRAAKEVTSVRGLQSIVKSAALAGATSGIESALGVSEVTSEMSSREALKTFGKKAAIGAGAKTLIYGGDLEDFLKDGLTSFALSAAHYGVGELGIKHGLEDGSLGKAVLHGAVGGAYAATQGADFGIGFLSGSIGELASPIMPEGAGASSKAGMLGAAIAFAAGGDVNDMQAASASATSAHKYNRELHPKELRVLKYVTKDLSPEDAKKYEKAAKSLIHSSEGLPDEDERKYSLYQDDIEGAKYEKERQELIQTSRETFGYEDGFVYSERDKIVDRISSIYDRPLEKTKYAGGVASGTLGAVSLGGVAMGSYASGNALVGTLTGSLSIASYKYALDSNKALFSKYRSKLGERVEESFKKEVGKDYLDRLATDASIEVASSIAATKAGHLATKGLMAAENLLLSIKSSEKAVLQSSAMALKPSSNGAVLKESSHKDSSLPAADSMPKKDLSAAKTEKVKVEKVKKESKTKSTKPKILEGDVIVAESGMRLKLSKKGKIKGVTHTEEHHIIHQSLSEHELFKKAGIDIDDRVNIMLLPTREGTKYTTTTRSVHSGRHLKRIKQGLEIRMNDLLEEGEINGYTQEKYKEEFKKIIIDERLKLKRGETILNGAKDHRKIKGE